MVGGKQKVFDKYYDLIKSMAGSVVRVGDVQTKYGKISKSNDSCS